MIACYESILVRSKKFWYQAKIYFVVIHLAVVNGTFAQDPNLPPSGNFDLSNWKITPARSI